MCVTRSVIHEEGGKEHMRKLKLVIIGVLVLMTALFVVFIGCENGAPDPTQEDLDKLGGAMAIALGDIEFGYDEPGVAFTGDPYSSEGGTVTFTDYENSSYSGILVNGSMNMKISGSGDTFSVILSGTLTFSGSGAPVQSIGFNMTITVDISDPYNPVITVSGTFSIDGEEFNASGIGELVMDYFG
jgi:hypothetical protein